MSAGLKVSLIMRSLTPDRIGGADYREESMAVDTLQKLDILKDVYSDEAALDLVLGKLLEGTLSDYRLRLQHYESALQGFERRYEMDSEVFYRRFEEGDLGDSMDFFEWAGLYELHQGLLGKIRRLEQAL